MAIPVKPEDAETIAAFGNVVEVCHFCRIKTRYWHENTNNPVCRSCAKLHKVSELPDHGKNIRARKRKERKGK